MAAEYDATEFVDNDFQAAHKTAYTGTTSVPGAVNRAPTREEVDSKVGEAQQKIAELKRVQEELERERSSLEEVRRRQMEFQNGRQETIQNLTRGVGLLEEAEFAARRDAEQMAKSLADMKEALAKVEATNEQSWTKENFNTELTRALTTIENARMEWNAARLKFAVLSGTVPTAESKKAEGGTPAQSALTNLSFGQLCKLGFAMTWPLALVALGAVGVLRRRCYRAADFSHGLVQQKETGPDYRPRPRALRGNRRARSADHTSGCTGPRDAATAAALDCVSAWRIRAGPPRACSRAARAGSHRTDL